jgi:starch-binding outer membrane protein, SusD/RagB family
MVMKKIVYIILFIFSVSSCREVLEPQPVDLLIDDLALNEPNDVANVQIGIYSAFRALASPVVVAGDFTADLVTHRGTFTQFRELSTKQIRPANDAIATLWGRVYRVVYASNFMLERLPDIVGVPLQQRREATATARFLRGLAYFIGVHTYGGIPIVTTTDVATNRTVPRNSKEEVLAFVLEDYLAALEELPDQSAGPAFAGKNAVRAALARYYLYQNDWVNAERYATEVINSGQYTLDANFTDIVFRDFPQESIFEVGYTIADDPGTSTYGLNNLFVGRREVIPSNQAVLALIANESGDRIRTLGFDPGQLGGTDNGWTVRKYGTADEDNNNIVIFRLAEMYLIRAEARANQNRVSGANSATEDINVLRERANAPRVSGVGAPSAMLRLIEQERVYELAYEGHRWYDLVRTGRAQAVMSAFSPNWQSTYEVWPIPLGETQRNPSLREAQNPGY